MRFGKEYIKIFAYVLILIVFIQLFRMEILFNTDPIENISTNDAKNSDIINKFLIIYSERNEKLTNTTFALDYLNVNYDLMESSEINSEYTNYNAIIVVEHDLNNIADMENLMLYVNDGGKLLYLVESLIQEGEQVNKYGDSVFEIIELGITNDSQVHMESNIGIPLMWSRKYESGEIMVVNIENYEEKGFREILIGAISILEG